MKAYLLIIACLGHSHIHTCPWGTLTHILIHSYAHSVQESKPPDLLSLLHALSVGPLAS